MKYILRYIRFIMIGLVAVFLAYFFFVVNRDARESSAQNFNQQQADRGGFITQTDEQGQVSVKVTPQVLANSTQWKFDVVFDTHSVDLNQDLVQIAVLVDDRGSEYKPTVWEGPGPGGHHREGVLVFEAISPVPSSIEVKIKDVGGVPERSFKWNTK